MKNIIFYYSPSDCRRKSEGQTSAVVSSVSPASSSDVSPVVLRSEVQCYYIDVFNVTHSFFSRLNIQGVLRNNPRPYYHLC